MNKTKKFKTITLLLIAFFITVSFLGIGKAEAPWLSDYGKRMLFYYQSSVVATNYQGSLTVINDTNFNTGNTFYIFNETLPSFEDLRVTQSDGTTLLPIWNQTTNQGVNCTFWAKFPTVNASYFLYWNNPSASNVWNQTTVFIDVIADVVGIWPMEETTGSIVKDFSSSGNNGTETNTTIVNGLFSGKKARDFEADNTSKIVTTTYTNLKIQTGSICVWVNPESTGASKVIMFKQGGTPFSGDYELRLSATNTVLFGLINGGGAQGGFSVTTIPTGSWSLLTGTYNGSTMLTYIGTSVAKTVNTVGTITQTNDIMAFGRRENNDFWFDGLMGYAFVTSSVLTPTNIANLNSSYADFSITTDKLFIRNYVYPAPAITLFGSSETAPATPTPTPDVTTEDAIGLALIGLMCAIALPIAFIAVKRIGNSGS